MLHLTINRVALNQSKVSNRVTHRSPAPPRWTPKEPRQANKGTSLESEHLNAKILACPACNGNLVLMKCQTFERKTFNERVQKMRKAQLCHNCFQYGHIARGCKAKGACQEEQRTFYLTTQEKQDSPQFGQEISLTAEAIDGSDKLEIQRLWTVEKVNASSHSIPTS